MKNVSLLLFFVLLPHSLHAEVVSLDIHQRKPFANGKAFGKTGPYEIITGVVRFAVDPKHPANQAIVDLNLAPRNKDGKIEFESDFVILAPKDISKGNGAILYDVNNRGRMLAVRFFNDSTGGNDLTKPKSEGNGFLMRQGYTVAWCGWIGELLPGDGHLLMRAPIATENGKPIRGLARFEMSTDEPVDSLPLSRRPGHGSYPPTKKGEKTGVLTWRARVDDKRVTIPNAQWKIERLPVQTMKDRVSGTLPEVRLHVAGGFRPGYLYELICEVEGPIVQGLGFAATRDLISHLRNDRWKGDIKRAHAFGVSQSGRFLRHFMYLGFNVDEENRKVFDGVMPHVAGGGLGFFNHRFAQPTRHNGQHEDHHYPADVFPFTYGQSTDPFTGRTDGILKNYEKNKIGMPKVMHTQSAAEYWHRGGSLPHTHPTKPQDAKIPANVRIYAFGGTQHGPDSPPGRSAISQNPVNTGDYRPFLRGLLVALDEWVKGDLEPPRSRYPRFADKTLVHWDQQSTEFPSLPGIRYPEVIQQPIFADWGSTFHDRGIISTFPPEVKGRYMVAVPKCDRDGNNLGTLLLPDVTVPIATYTGWNLRRTEVGAEDQLASLQGSYLPFAKTKKERLAAGDPRLSLDERYKSFGDYRRAVVTTCRVLVVDRYMLLEDHDRIVNRADGRRGLFGEK